MQPAQLFTITTKLRFQHSALLKNLKTSNLGLFFYQMIIRGGRSKVGFPSGTSDKTLLN